MMKKILTLFLISALIASLCACGQEAHSWQEQYDLGVRYLSEGNYEEAIIAFTAAIEIDPKQALAYAGRGDAYVASGETEENLMAARADYEKAIELDRNLENVYLNLADIYIRQSNYDSARNVLKEGMIQIGDKFHTLARYVELEKILNQEVSSTVEKNGNRQQEYYGPSEDFSLPLTFYIVESEGNIYDAIKPFYELKIVDGQYLGGKVEGIDGIILYGNLNVKCKPSIDGNPYILRGITDTSLSELHKGFSLFCPSQYADSSDPTMKNLHYESYEDFFNSFNTQDDHGGGWNCSKFIDEDNWFLAVAAYNFHGTRIGYAIYQMTDSSELQEIRQNCMVTINRETGMSTTNP